MKFLIYFSLVLLPLSNMYARDPGTGSNTTVGPGPVTPDAGSSDTSVMGGGTPGNQGIDNLGMKDNRNRRIQKQDEVNEKNDEYTDQDKDQNTIQDL